MAKVDIQSLQQRKEEVKSEQRILKENIEKVEYQLTYIKRQRDRLQIQLQQTEKQ